MIKKQECPICGYEMVFVTGNGWDYDRWMCPNRIGLKLCEGEIELETITYFEDIDSDKMQI